MHFFLSKNGQNGVGHALDLCGSHRCCKITIWMDSLFIVIKKRSYTDEKAKAEVRYRPTCRGRLQTSCQNPTATDGFGFQSSRLPTKPEYPQNKNYLWWHFWLDSWTGRCCRWSECRYYPTNFELLSSGPVHCGNRALIEIKSHQAELIAKWSRWRRAKVP